MSESNGNGTRVRVYWKSDQGMEHGWVRRELPQGGLEVYSFRTGETAVVRSSAIQKRIQECLE